MRFSRWLAFAFLMATATAVASIPHPPRNDALDRAAPRYPALGGETDLKSWGFTAAPAAPVIVQDAKPIPLGGFADLSIEVPKTASVVWRISPNPVQKAAGLPSSRLIFGGVQGTTYTVTAIVVDFDAKTVVDTDTSVVFGGTPAPDPKPQPDPKPNPKPDPVVADGKVTHFVVVEDTTAAGSWRGDILGSPKVAAFYQQLQGTRSGSIHLLVDIHSPSGATAKKYADLAAGKKLPYLWLLDGPPETGKVLKELAAPIDTPDAFVAAFDLHQTPRKLGMIVAPPKLKWTKFGSTPETPLIPRDQWKPVSLAAFLPPVYDQDGIGQCASSACCTTIETAARVAGKPFPKLSAGDLYSRVNGGRDDGSMLEDNLAEAVKNGVAPASMVPYVWDRRKPANAAAVAERKRYRIVEAYLCEDFDAMASALQQGFVLEHGLMWRDNFSPDGDGWLPARGAGGAGGHAECGFSLEKRNGVWGIGTRNSWSASWGNGGNSIIPESLFDSKIGGFFAVRVVTSGEPVARNPLQIRDTEFALAW